MIEEFDYVVVGSGAGGASAARVFADVTRSVAVVEEGHRVEPSGFQDHAFPTFRRLYRGMGAQLTAGRAPMPVLQACCVGGTTVVNSAILRRLPEEVWGEWDRMEGVGQGFSHAVLDAASVDIERELQATPTPARIWGRNNELLSRAASGAGLAGRPTLRNAPDCRGSGRCNLGCPYGAKLSMDRSYLPYAEARGARTFAGERAEKVLWRSRRAVGVATRTRTLLARKAVVIAASAVQTPGLLSRSGIRNRHLGRHFQGHPGMAVVGIFDEPVRVNSGATQGYEVDGWRTDLRVKLETLAVTPETFAGSIPGVGRNWVSLIAEYAHAAVWVLPLRSLGEGTVGTGWRDGRLTFRLHPADLANLRRGLTRAVELLFAVGARQVVCPIDRLPDRLGPRDIGRIAAAGDDPSAYPLAMSHLFGTARMSAGEARGVTGLDFRVHQTDNLYVVDASVFPTNLGVNPQLTIMAMARIAAERLTG
jgi:choline dehydrogenase-like flavoprotein